jgi:hypothetical protein
MTTKSVIYETKGKARQGNTLNWQRIYIHNANISASIAMLQMFFISAGMNFITGEDAGGSQC